MSALSAASTTSRLFAKAWEWPAADRVTAGSVALPLDTTQFMADLATGLSAILELPVTAVASDDKGVVPATMYIRADGFAVAAGVPDMLAGALLGYRCGGCFVPARASRAGVASIVTEIETAVLEAAGRHWPGSGEWLAAPIDVATPPFAVRLEIEGHAFVLAVVIRQPVPVLPEASRGVDHGDWTEALRSALDATPFGIRAVLHDGMIPLSEALALRVGTVLPIETRRDVSLRLGEYALARGTITPDDAGGHRITVAVVGPPQVIPAAMEKQP